MGPAVRITPNMERAFAKTGCKPTSACPVAAVEKAKAFYSTEIDARS
jgi:hypothetical protein